MWSSKLSRRLGIGINICNKSATGRDRVHCCSACDADSRLQKLLRLAVREGCAAQRHGRYACSANQKCVIDVANSVYFGGRHQGAKSACEAMHSRSHRLGATATKAVMKTQVQFEIPAEFQQRLDANSELAEAFHALTPVGQKGYLLHFAGAKQSATRTGRVDYHAPRIL
jgi:hypothetical protein